MITQSLLPGITQYECIYHSYKMQQQLQVLIEVTCFYSYVDFSIIPPADFSNFVL